MAKILHADLNKMENALNFSTKGNVADRINDAVAKLGDTNVTKKVTKASLVKAGDAIGLKLEETTNKTDLLKALVDQLKNQLKTGKRGSASLPAATALEPESAAETPAKTGLPGLPMGLRTALLLAVLLLIPIIATWIATGGAERFFDSLKREPQTVEIHIGIDPLEGTVRIGEEPAAVEPETPEAVPAAVEPETPEAVPAAVEPENTGNCPTFDPLNIDGLKQFRQALPGYEVFRDLVFTEGDPTTGVLLFGRDYGDVTLARTVADDVFTSIIFYTGDCRSDPVELLPLLNMGMVDEETLAAMDANQKLVLAAQGVNVEVGEILAQNLNTVRLNVKAGDYIVFRARDDADLGVNNGVGFDIHADSLPNTVDTKGNPVPATFIPEGFSDQQ